MEFKATSGMKTRSPSALRSFCRGVLPAAGLTLLLAAHAGAQAPAANVPAGPPTVQVLREFSREHGFVVSLGEAFANQWVFTERCDEGPYHDVVMEAVIDGTQSTKSRTTLDVVAWPNAARMLLRLDGVTNNRAVAKTPQAAIETTGSYEFHLTKQVEFDGRLVQTWSPSAFLHIQQRHIGAATPVSMVPLLGPLANNVALGVAQQRKPMAEQIAAVRVTGCVAPEFNNRVDQGLAALNQKLETDVRGKLEAVRLGPRRVAARSTDDVILFGAAYRDSFSSLPVVELGERVSLNKEVARARLAQAPLSLPPLLVSPADESFAPLPSEPSPSWEQLPLPQVALIAVHEALVADFSRLSPMAGWNISDLQLNQLLSTGDAAPEGASEGLADLAFSSEQPARAEFRNGEMLFSLRIVFRPKLGPALPEQELTLAVQPVVESTTVRFPIELRSLRAVNGWGDESMRLLAEPILRAAISQRLKEREIPRDFDIPRDDGRPPIPARLHSLSAQDGWLSIAIEPRALPSVNLRPEWDVQSAQK